MGMAQGRDRLGLALKARFQVRIGRKMGGQDFDGDIAAEPRIARTADFSHAARAQRRLNLVWPEFRAGSQPHLCGRLYSTCSTRAACSMRTSRITLRAGRAWGLRKWPLLLEAEMQPNPPR